MKLSSLIEVLPAGDIKRLGVKPGEDVDVYSIGFDSRQSLPGELFVALKGTNFDGEDYVDDALSKGAVAIVSEREALRLGCEVPEIVVKDAKQALGLMSAAFFGNPTNDMKLIGVTGTNGKTTVTYMIESILKAASRRTGLLGTIGYKVGDKTMKAPYTTPLAPQLQGLFKEMVDGGTTDCVMEVSSHALSERRVDGCSFDAVVFTNLTEEHMDYYDTMNRYFRAKERLFRDERLHKDGATAVVNVDDMWGEMLVNDSGGGVIKYSLDDGADIYPIKSMVKPEGIEASFTTPIGVVKISSNLTGEYNLYNIMAAIGAAIAVGVDKVAIEEGLSNLSSVPGRLERVGRDSKLWAYVDYAHTPDALKRSIEVLRGFVGDRGGRLITVFGCGGDRDRSKRPAMGDIAARLSDVAIITSDNPRGEEPAAIAREIAEGIEEIKEVNGDDSNNSDGYMIILDRQEAIERAVTMAKDGDTILVAGKGHEDYQVVRGERLLFDDRVVLEEAISKRSLNETS